MKNWMVLFLALCIPLTAWPLVEKKPLSATVARALNVGTDATPLQILGVAENASEADIKRAYRRLALKWHPDKKSNLQKEESKLNSEEVFSAINTAHAQLTGKEDMPVDIEDMPVDIADWEFQKPPSFQRCMVIGTLATIYIACLVYLYRTMYPEDDAPHRHHHQKPVTAGA